jgi:hypothetical protein
VSLVALKVSVSLKCLLTKKLNRQSLASTVKWLTVVTSAFLKLVRKKAAAVVVAVVASAAVAAVAVAVVASAAVAAAAAVVGNFVLTNE